MTEEKKDEIYGRVNREYDTLCKDFAACSSELKRIGVSFQDLGGKLVDSPEKALTVEQSMFEKDAQEWRELAKMYCELGAAKEAKKSELERLR